jgi:putative transposase
VDIGCYCLMPNHEHLLLYEREENGISTFIAKLFTAYVKYFNHRHQRSGALFDGRFRARHANTDAYLHYLYAYIHLNPIKLIQSDWKKKGIRNLEKAEQFLRHYHASSFLDYTGHTRSENNILDASNFPDYFDNKTDFKKFIKEWLTYKDEAFLT